MINIKIIKYLALVFSFLLIFLFVSFIFSYIDIYDSSKGEDSIENNSEQTILNRYDKITSKVIPYIVKAKVTINDIEYVGEVIEDKQNGETYHILINDESNWYDKYYVTILDLDEKVVEQLSDEEIEIYVNFSSFNLTSDYFIWVDLYRIQTYLLRKENNYYKFVKRFDCSTGADITPTKRGFYNITNKGTHFYSRDNTYICYNFLQYSGSYLLHSFPYSLDKNVLDDSLNKRVSNGCVRFSFLDSKYLYDIIDIGTNIWIN